MPSVAVWPCSARSTARAGCHWRAAPGVNTDAEAVRDAELRYAQRYRTPRANPRRVVIEVHIERVLGSSDLLDRGD